MARPAKRSTIRDELVRGRKTLASVGYRDGWLDAEVLLAHVLGVDRAWLHGHPERVLTTAQGRRFQGLLERRRRHAPVAYLLGEKEFYGHTLKVTPAVLIPRPETELLVDLAIDWLRIHPSARRVIDIGTGSGAIAIAIAKAVRSVHVIAIDVDARALRVARENVVRQRVKSRVDLRQGDLLAGAPPADLIVANLPYVSARRLRSAAPELGYEPAVALSAGRDGLDVIRRIIAQAASALGSGGCLLLEFDAPQAGRLQRLARAVWPSATITIHQDLAGLDRAIRVERS